MWLPGSSFLHAWMVRRGGHFFFTLWDVMAWNKIWTFEQPNTGSIYGDDPRRRSCALLISQYLMINKTFFLKPSTTPVTQRALPQFPMIRSDFCHGRLALWMPGRLSGRRSRCVFLGLGAGHEFIGRTTHGYIGGTEVFPDVIHLVLHIWESDPWDPWRRKGGIFWPNKNTMLLMDQPSSTRGW